MQVIDFLRCIYIDRKLMSNLLHCYLSLTGLSVIVSVYEKLVLKYVCETLSAADTICLERFL